MSFSLVFSKFSEIHLFYSTALWIDFMDIEILVWKPFLFKLKVILTP